MFFTTGSSQHGSLRGALCLPRYRGAQICYHLLIGCALALAWLFCATFTDSCCCGSWGDDPNTVGFWLCLLVANGWLVLRSVLWAQVVGGFPAWAEGFRDGLRWSLAVARPHRVESLPLLLVLLDFCTDFAPETTDTLSQRGNLVAHLLLAGLALGLTLLAPLLGASLGSVMGQDSQRGYRLAQRIAFASLGWFVLLPFAYAVTHALPGPLRSCLAFPVLPLALALLGALLWLRSCAPATPGPRTLRVRWVSPWTLFVVAELTSCWLVSTSGIELLPLGLGLGLLFGLVLDRAMGWLPEPGLLVWQKTVTMSALVGLCTAIGGTAIMTAIAAMEGYWWQNWSGDLVTGCQIGLVVGLVQVVQEGVTRVIDSPHGLWALAGED